MHRSSTQRVRAQRTLAACLQRCVGCEKLSEREILSRVGALISVLRVNIGSESHSDPWNTVELECPERRGLITSLRCLLGMRCQRVTPAVLRVLRYAMQNPVMQIIIQEEFLDLFVVRSLDDRESSTAAERVEVLKLFEMLTIMDPTSISDPQVLLPSFQLCMTHPTFRIPQSGIFCRFSVSFRPSSLWRRVLMTRYVKLHLNGCAVSQFETLRAYLAGMV